LWLSILAYNLGNLWRRLAKHARYYWLLLAEGHLTRGRFAAMLRRIAMQEAGFSVNRGVNELSVNSDERRPSYFGPAKP
jgi:hypothetical protein